MGHNVSGFLVSVVILTGCQSANLSTQAAPNQVVIVAQTGPLPAPPDPIWDGIKAALETSPSKLVTYTVSRLEVFNPTPGRVAFSATRTERTITGREYRDEVGGRFDPASGQITDLHHTRLLNKPRSPDELKQAIQAELDRLTGPDGPRLTVLDVKQSVDYGNFIFHAMRASEPIVAAIQPTLGFFDAVTGKIKLAPG